MSADTGLLDKSVIEALAEELGTDTSIYLLGLFVTELEDLSSKLPVVIASKDLAGIKDITHILKNSATVYGANPLATASKDMYDNNSLSLQQSISSAEQILDLCQRTQTAYRVFLVN